ncbi:MAG: hypothetical protein A3C35_08540 [Omnitrophica bacterium RIFCSPHIGHO2_02_FULL_46_11]|nr:MAG: hypothetical protein A3A81_06240 [Omnitrophica bacterium RIFCSPLOWO2_01_FULL_45_10b]OGW87977.1 MAG: hypothetical protein A3C35_08540 [Omnitrophica bacterium RIFCSPHIGHO2_02_FULL_46_11]
MALEQSSTSVIEKMIVSEPKISLDGDSYVYSFSVTLGKKLHEIQYRTPFPPTDNSNVALAATLLPAMKLSAPLRLRGSVSEELFGSVTEIQQIFSVWDEGFNLVPIENGVANNHATNHKNEVACFFSGGVDSFYTLLKNEKEITHIILVHGFDFQSDFAGKEEVVKNITEVASKLGKKLVQVDSNLRSFSDNYVTWGFYHGAMLASVALLLSTKFKKVFIPSTHSFRWLVPWGSHPLTDPLWSLRDMEIIHDGCEAKRVDKVAAIAKNDVAMAYLRVCWENKGGAYNCGACEKCLRTMINLLVVGALDKCKTFSRQLELWRVARIKIDSESTRDFILENLQVTKKLRSNSGVVQALNDCLRGLYYKGIWGWPYRALNLIKRKGPWRVVRS